MLHLRKEIRQTFCKEIKQIYLLWAPKSRNITVTRVLVRQRLPFEELHYHHLQTVKLAASAWVPHGPLVSSFPSPMNGCRWVCVDFSCRMKFGLSLVFVDYFFSHSHVEFMASTTSSIHSEVPVSMFIVWNLFCLVSFWSPETDQTTPPHRHPSVVLNECHMLVCL